MIFWEWLKFPLLMQWFHGSGPIDSYYHVILFSALEGEQIRIVQLHPFQTLSFSLFSSESLHLTETIVFLTFIRLTCLNSVIILLQKVFKFVWWRKLFNDSQMMLYFGVSELLGNIFVWLLTSGRMTSNCLLLYSLYCSADTFSSIYFLRHTSNDVLMCRNLYALIVCSSRSRVKGHLRLYLAYFALGDGEVTPTADETPADPITLEVSILYLFMIVVVVLAGLLVGVNM